MQPDGARIVVRNGTEGTMVATNCRQVMLRLDSGEDTDQVVLPGGYVGDSVDYAYAVTAHEA